MTDKQKVESYLSTLERALSGAPAGRRSEIIIEMKGQIENAVARLGSADAALAEIGSVETVCHRYGYIPTIEGYQGWRWIKRILIVIILLFFGGCVAVSALIWKMARISNHFILSNEAWDEDTFKNQLRLGGNPFPLDDDEQMVIEREKSGIKDFTLRFSNAKIRFSQAENDVLKIRCKVHNIEKIVKEKEIGETFDLDLSDSQGAKCDIAIPKNVNLKSKGSNGEVQVVKPQFHVDIGLSNGSVELEPDRSQKYKYDLKVENGRMEDFLSSDEPNAYNISVRLANGMISRRRD